jgi:hypothetical protein
MARSSRLRLRVLMVVAVVVLLPSRWWSGGVPPVMHAQAPAGQATPPDTYEGILNIIWGDPRVGSDPAETVYSLEMPDGTSLPLQLTGQENTAITYFGKPVVVTGRAGARPAPANAGSPGVSGIVVDSIRPAHSFAQGAPDGVSPAPALGTKRVLFLLLKFADDTAVPHPPSFFLNLTNPDTPSAGIPATINAVFRKSSNNQFSWIADVGGAGGIGAPTGDGWIVLPQPKNYYAPCGSGTSCFSTSRFNTDAVAAGKAQGINFAPYDNINFVISNDLDCCAWGGGTSIDGKFFGATWEPPWAQETDTYSHEMGHSLGLPHSGWVYYSYDSMWDIMSSPFSASSATCGSYFSRNAGGNRNITCTEPGAGYIAPYRDYLGWIPPANVVQTSTPWNVNVMLEGAALTIAANPKMIKICLPGFACTGTGARFFTVEARVKGGGTSTQFDNAIPGDGVLIHDVQMSRPAISGPCYFNNQSGWAVPIDATPGDYNTSTCTAATGGALRNAQFVPGQTYTNSTYGFRVVVGARTGNSFAVSVQSTAGTEMGLNGPANGTTVGRPFTVQGWAINRQATTGTGIDTVHVYAAPAGGGAAIFLGAATYGGQRDDVAAIYGAQFRNSGFTLSAGASLTPGNYTVTAYAHNPATGAFDANRSATITVSGPVSNGYLFVDTPTPSATVTSAFEIGGWTIDQGATSGTGVDGVQFYVFPNGGAGAGVFMGVGSYGAPRTDVGSIFGSQFTNSGYHFTITGLGPGSYVLGVYAHSTVTNAFSIVRTVAFNVSANALMSIDVPSAESTITANSFGLSGWAIDTRAASGTGVDTIHVYAYRNPGTAQQSAAIFLGVATMGIARQDVANAYGGGASRYTNCGYVLQINRSALGLTPGVYNIVPMAHSTATNSFDNLAIVRVTIQ